MDKYLKNKQTYIIIKKITNYNNNHQMELLSASIVIIPVIS